MDEKQPREDVQNINEAQRQKARDILSQGFQNEDTPSQKPVADIPENAFQLDALSEQELIDKQEEARRALSGEAYKPKKSTISKISRHDLAALQKEALSRGKKTEELMKKQEVMSKQPPLETKSLTPNVSVEQSTQKNSRPETRTMQSDIQEEVKNKKLSLAQIALAEQAKRRSADQSNFFAKERTWQRIVLLASIFLVLLGGGTITYIAFFSEDAQNVPLPPEQNKTYLITPNSERRIVTTNLSNEVVQQTFDEILHTSEAGQGTIQSLAFVKQENPEKREHTIEEVFEILNITPPDRLLRSLSGEYMVGLYSGENNASFFALSVSSFENAFSGMLAWEKETLRTLPDRLSTRQVSPEGRETRWADAFVRNIDARLLVDSTEDIFLIYSFLDKETLIITPDRDTFLELVDRYNTPEKVLR